MSFAFESHALPVLQDMARDPLAGDYPVKRRMLELGVVRDDDQADRLLELMRDDGYIEFRGQQNGTGAWAVLFDVRLTAKALKQLDMWPDDNERGLYLLRRVADAFDSVAVDMEAAGMPTRTAPTPCVRRLFRSVASRRKSGPRSLPRSFPTPSQAADGRFGRSGLTAGRTIRYDVGVVAT